MKKKYLTLLMFIPFLAGCTKTEELYADYAYKSSNFMENYYTEHNGVDQLKVASTNSFNLHENYGYNSSNSLKYVRQEDNPEGYPWSESVENYSNEFGRHNNLTSIDSSFAYGYLSKLYDGRVRCEGKYELSRVQLDRGGYATFFPKKLNNYRLFAFSLRGATDYYKDNLPTPFGNGTGKVPCKIDINIKFYKHILNSDQYDVVDLKLSDVEIPADAGGSTNLVTVYLAEDNDDGTRTLLYSPITETVAMSFDFTLKNDIPGLSDDSKAESDHHFAVMLYEVLFPRSTWR